MDACNMVRGVGGQRRCDKPANTGRLDKQRSNTTVRRSTWAKEAGGAVHGHELGDLESTM